MAIDWDSFEDTRHAIVVVVNDDDPNNDEVLTLMKGKK